jgi:hypothetical protein
VIILFFKYYICQSYWRSVYSDVLDNWSIFFLLNLIILSTPRYSWNTAKVGIKHQSININFRLQDEIFLLFIELRNAPKIFRKNWSMHIVIIREYIFLGPLENRWFSGHSRIQDGHHGGNLWWMSFHKVLDNYKILRLPIL